MRDNRYDTSDMLRSKREGEIEGAAAERRRIAKMLRVEAAKARAIVNDPKRFHEFERYAWVASSFERAAELAARKPRKAGNGGPKA